MPMNDDASSGDERILIVPPTRRDGEVTRLLLGRAGFACKVCADLEGLAAEVAAGVGVVMLTDKSLFDPGMAAVLAALSEQPAWSDVPVVALLNRDLQHSDVDAGVLGRLTNVTTLDRPVSTRSMMSALSAALRGRRRQYQLRDHLAAMARAEQALRDADRQKDKFIATLAHELRNPLAPLRNGLQLLSGAAMPPDKARHVREMMERQLMLLIKLIDDLLDVSRISTGKVVLRARRMDLREAIEAALEGSQLWVTAAGHGLRVDLPDRPVWVMGDPTRLEQVIANLVNNAAKYTPSGGSIRVSLVEDKGQGEAVLRVEDNGIGIPPDMLSSVFNLFTQVSRHLERAQGGLGIGLSLVRQLVDLHGGSVVAESAGPGLGSAFTVRLKTLAEGDGRRNGPSSAAVHAPVPWPMAEGVERHAGDASRGIPH